MTGNEHTAKARKRILDWMEMRWKYGFTEFYSNVYYSEDIGGMINLIDFAADEEIVKKMQIVMDLLMFDVASQNIKNMFVSASGRAYEHSRKGGPGTTLGGITDFYWGSGKKLGEGLAYGLVTSKKYSLPPVIAVIGRDTSNVEIRQSNGLDKGWLPSEGYRDNIRKGWKTLAGYVNKKGEVRNVCVGTNAKDNKKHYLTRPKSTGNFHGQAAALWAATAMTRLEAKNKL